MTKTKISFQSKERREKTDKIVASFKQMVKEFHLDGVDIFNFSTNLLIGCMIENELSEEEIRDFMSVFEKMAISCMKKIGCKADLHDIPENISREDDCVIGFPP